MKKNEHLLDTLILFLFFLYCIFISLNRLIARDEGFYIIAGELILEGFIPYKDFFFPQMPFTALFFAFCMKVFGISWFVARGVCGIIYFLAGSTLFFYIKSKFNLKLAFFSLIAISFSPMAFPWFPILKSYAFVILLLLVIFITIEHLKNNIKTLSTFNIHSILFFIGICFGFLGLVRLYFLGILPVIFLHLYETKNTKVKDYFYFCLGTITALSPAIILFFIDYKNFIFNNLGYHLVRAQTPIDAALTTKIASILKILGLNTSMYLSQPQMIITYLMPIIWGIFYFFRIKKTHHIYFPIVYTIWICMLNSMPSPTYLQYHCCIIPFIIIITCDLINFFKNKKIQQFIFYFFIGTFCIYYPQFFSDYILTGENVIGIGGQDSEDWHLNNIEEVQNHLNIINSTTKREKYTLAPWPGHTLGKNYLLLPGTENPFSRKVSDEISKKYNLLKKEDILDNIKNNNIKTVVYSANLNMLELKNFLIKYDFTLRSRIGNVYIWSKKEL